MKRIITFALVMFILVTSGCSTYQYRPIPFRSAETFSGHRNAFGAVLAAQYWKDRSMAHQDFGFDVIGAGITPVQVILDNKGPNTLWIDTDQTMLRDVHGNLWHILPAQVAYERIEKWVAPGRMVEQGVQTGAVGAMTGAIIGTAVGIITRGDIGEDILRGAAIGAAAGAVTGGHHGLHDPYSKAQIAEDLRTRDLKEKPINPMTISHGFLFFPGEVGMPAVLRLRLRSEGAAADKIVELPLQHAVR